MNKQYQNTTTSCGEVKHPQFDFLPKGPKLEECDLPRLRTKAREVWDIMAGTSYPDAHKNKRGWWNLNHIAEALNIPHSTVTACVRGFRNLENGGHTVETRREVEGSGTYLYRLKPNTPDGVKMAKEAAKAKKICVDELLVLNEWIHNQIGAHGGWSASPFTMKIIEKIQTMVKERK